MTPNVGDWLTAKIDFTVDGSVFIGGDHWVVVDIAGYKGYLGNNYPPSYKLTHMGGKDVVWVVGDHLANLFNVHHET